MAFKFNPEYLFGGLSVGLGVAYLVFKPAQSSAPQQPIVLPALTDSSQASPSAAVTSSTNGASNSGTQLSSCGCNSCEAQTNSTPVNQQLVSSSVIAQHVANLATANANYQSYENANPPTADDSNVMSLQARAANAVTHPAINVVGAALNATYPPVQDVPTLASLYQ